MRVLADQWYTSGAFLGFAGIAVGLVGIIVGVWAAFRAANPKQRLLYQVSAAVPILTGESREVRDVVEVLFEGKPLENPQVLEFHLVNAASGDIPADAFNRERPLRIEIGVPVKKVLGCVSVPDGQEVPEITHDGESILIGPDLIKRRQMVKVTLLLDGADPKVSVPNQSLINVEVCEYRGNLAIFDQDASRWLRLGRWMKGLAVLCVGELFVDAQFFKQSGPAASPTVTATPMVAGLAFGGIGLFILALLVRSRAINRALSIQASRNRDIAP